MGGHPVIGFCILSHRDEAQLLRLTRTLNTVYSDPPIVCHHDVSQSPVDVGLFAPNVTFVTPSVRTGWGRMSVIKAGLAAIAQMCARSGPDWLVLLSAADYPIRAADDLRALLSDTSHDAFIDTRPLLLQTDTSAAVAGAFNPQLGHFASPANARIKSRFYLSPEMWIPIIRFAPRLRLGRYTYRPGIVSPAVKASGINVHYGDHWFMANARAARRLVEDSATKRFLMTHLADRTQVDECFYQTMLLNSPDLSICRDNRRYAEWNGGGAHPMTLTVKQVPDMQRSGAFFARKFGDDPTVYDTVDRELLGFASG